jgi:F-type H+-transporting ATPase subunit b
MTRPVPSSAGALVALALTATPALASEEGGIQIQPDLTLAPILFVLFLVLILLVNRVLLRPLLAVIDEREERIAGSRSRAEQVTREAEEVLAGYESAVRAAQGVAERQRLGALEEARREQAAAAAAARRDAEEHMGLARAEVAAAVEDARGQLRREAEGLARELAGRVLGRPLA